MNAGLLFERAFEGPISEIGNSLSFIYRPTILLVDDDQSFRALVQAFLEDEPCNLIQAEDGLAGMAILTRQPVDLLIADIVMPNQEGLSTIRQVRGQFPKVKIVAVSGAWASSDYLRVARHLGANETLRKPITRESLLDTLGRLGSLSEC